MLARLTRQLRVKKLKKQKRKRKKVKTKKKLALQLKLCSLVCRNQVRDPETWWIDLSTPPLYLSRTISSMVCLHLLPRRSFNSRFFRSFLGNYDAFDLFGPAEVGIHLIDSIGAVWIGSDWDHRHWKRKQLLIDMAAGGFVTRAFESMLKECSGGKKYPALQKAIQAFLGLVLICLLNSARLHYGSVCSFLWIAGNNLNNRFSSAWKCCSGLLFVYCFHWFYSFHCSNALISSFTEAWHHFSHSEFG